MSLTGKILAVLNVLAAIPLVILAVMDFGARKNWAYTVFRYDLHIGGAPVDDKVTTPDDVKQVNDLDERTLAKLQQVGGQPIKTQEEEVTRVRQLLGRKLEADEPLAVKDPQLKANLEQIKQHERARLVSAAAGDNRAAGLFRAIDEYQSKLAKNQELTAPEKRLKELDAKAAKVEKLAWMLRPFATSFERREALTRLMVTRSVLWPELPPLFAIDSDGKTDPDAALARLGSEVRNNLDVDRFEKPWNALLDELTTQLDTAWTKLFKDVLEKRGLDEKKRAVAGLLVGVSELLHDDERAADKPTFLDSTAYKRAVAVIGLDAALKELVARGSLLQRMAREAQYAIERERDVFVQRYEGRLLQVAEMKAAAEEAERQRVETWGKDNQGGSVAAQKKREASQKERAEKAQQELDKLRGETDALLKDQQKKEKEIFDRQKELRDAIDKNRALEARLRELEGKVR